MHRLVPNPAGDTFGRQSVAHHVVLSAKDLRLDGEDIAVERTSRVTRVPSQQADTGDLAEALFQIGRHFFPLPGLFGEAFDSHDAQGGLQLRQAVVGAHREPLLGLAMRCDLVVWRGLGVGATAVDDAGRPRRKLRCATQQHAALPCREDLRRLKTERAEVPDGASPAAAPLGAVRVCAILDHDQAVPFGDLHNGVHVGHLCAQVDWDDGPRFRSYRRFGRLGVDAVGLGVNVHDHRHGPGRHGGRRRGLEGVGWHDHLVAPADVRGAQRDLHRDGAVDHRHRVATPLQLGKAADELSGLRPRIRVTAPLTGLYDARNRGDVTLVVDGPGGVGFSAGGRATQDR